MVQAIKLSIKDTGCGIPEEKINSIFMPYESNHSNEHNLGLGLSIVAKIIKDHHGQIKVHSDVGVGTTVAIWLPLSKSGESNAKDVDQMFELMTHFLNKIKIIGYFCWIRTNVEINSADLQSAAIDHSAIPPQEYYKNIWQGNGLSIQNRLYG